MSNKKIIIDTNKCVKCNNCENVCEWLNDEFGYLYCIYCKGECTQICSHNAIKLVANIGPHTILCRDKNTNNFINDMEE